MKKAALLAMMFLAGAPLFAGPRVVVGIGLGVAPVPVAAYVAPPPAPVAYVAPAPGAGFVWVGGYWNGFGPRAIWVPGRWVRPPFPRAAWVAPRFFGGRYYRGYWRR
jgi:hypothetical protein